VKILPTFSLAAAEEKGCDRTDYVLAAFCFLANLFILVISWQTVGVQADESVYIFGALRLLNGEQIYRDFWVFNPPGIYLWIAAITAFFGKSLLAIRLVLFFTSSLASAILYLLFRKLAGRWFALVPAVLFAMVGVNLWPVSGHQWYSTLLILFSVFFVASFLEDHSRRSFLFVGGVLAGTVFLFQQPKGGFLVASISSLLVIEPWLVRKRHERLKDAFVNGCVFSLGSAFILLVTAAFFLYKGTLGDAFNAVILYPMKMMSHNGADNSGFGSFYGSLTADILSNLVRRSSFFSDGRISIPIVIFLINYAAPFSIPLAFVAWVTRRLRNQENNLIGLVCVAGAAAAFTAPLIRPDFHHLLSVTAPEYITLAYVLYAFWDNGVRKKAGKLLKIAAACCILVLMAASFRIEAANIAFSSRLTILPLRSPLGFIPVLLNSDAPESAIPLPPVMNVLDFLEVRTQPTEKIFVMSFSPFIYYLSGKESPARCIDVPSSPCLVTDFHALKFGEASVNRGRLVNAVEDLEADRTRWIVLDPATSCQFTNQRFASAATSDPLVEYILRHYEIEEQFTSWIIMRRID
jgi:hypothetical protein